MNPGLLFVSVLFLVAIYITTTFYTASASPITSRIISYKLYMYGFGAFLFVVSLILPQAAAAKKTEGSAAGTINVSVNTGTAAAKEEHEAVKVLKVRYAKGEITKAEYNEMLKELETTYKDAQDAAHGAKKAP